jgi:hypothetical protein
VAEKDAYGRHEVLDRSHIIEDMIAGFLLEHAVVKADPELLEAAQKAHQAAFDLYQLAGRKFL